MKSISYAPVLCSQESWFTRTGGMAQPANLPHRCPAPVYADRGPVRRPEEAVSALSGPHGQRGQRGKNWHPRVPVAVQTPAVELLHRR